MCVPCENTHDKSSTNEDHAHSSLEDPGGSPQVLGVSPYYEDLSHEALLELCNPAYILAQVKRVVHSVPPDMDLEDIAQEVSISLWQKLERVSIQNPEAYITRMIHNKCIDAWRRHHIDLQPLPAAENGEIIAGDILLTPGEGMADPAEEFEQKSAIIDLTEKVAYAVSKLPARQQQAMAYSLLRKVDNFIQIANAFNAHHVEVEVHPTEDKAERHLLQASLPPARVALAKHLKR
ncbi:MAG TPA: sigma-70 family RNA polymerase sigma factor [Ktedonobacteraceae bacterium]